MRQTLESVFTLQMQQKKSSWPLWNVLEILLTPNISRELIDFSEKLLAYFVDEFEKLYWKHFISHNVHGLFHIVDDYT